MTILTGLFSWIEPLLVDTIEWLPFINDGQLFWDTLSSWALRFLVGGGIASYPLYQVLIARYSIGVVKRLFRKVLRIAIWIGIIALVVKFAL